MKTIEIILSPEGDIRIDAIGFKGADCELATQYLEEALGVAGLKVKKPEHLLHNHSKPQQKVGT